MGGRTVIWCLSVFVFYFTSMIADGYVVVVNIPEENKSVEGQNNEKGLALFIKSIGIENWYNWYKLAFGGADIDSIICGTTDKGYKYFNSTRSCYKFHTDRATWNDAEATCVREGGHLAVVNSQDEADFFMTRITDLFFLGIHMVERSWVTVHGQTLSEAGYHNWREGSPSNHVGQSCGALRLDGKITDIHCKYDMPFICEKDPRYRLPTDATEAQTSTEATETENSSETETSSEKTPRVGINNCGTTDIDYTYLESTQSCYKVHTDRATWNDAEATCVREGGHLAVVHSLDELNLFIGDFPVDSYQVFMGFHLDLKDNSWVTVHGETLEETGYENWNDGEPNNAGGGQYCGSMYPEGTFDDISCNEQLAFICQKNSTMTTDTHSVINTSEESRINPSAGLISNNDNKCNTMANGYTFFESTWSCYKVHTDRATWNDAEATCVREGGHLAVVNSQDEADILSSMYPEGAMHVFLGFSYRVANYVYDRQRSQIAGWSEWRTIDGRSLQSAGYENWSPGEPNNAGGSEYCGTMYGNGKFDDSDCTEEFDFICEVTARF